MLLHLEDNMIVNDNNNISCNNNNCSSRGKADISIDIRSYSKYKLHKNVETF